MFSCTYAIKICHLSQLSVLRRSRSTIVPCIRSFNQRGTLPADFSTGASLLPGPTGRHIRRGGARHCAPRGTVCALNGSLYTYLRFHQATTFELNIGEASILLLSLSFSPRQP